MNEHPAASDEGIKEIKRMIDTYGVELLRMCFLYLKDQQLAQDAMQETWISAWKNRAAFEHRSSEKTWLTRIAINACKKILRAKWYQNIFVSLDAVAHTDLQQIPGIADLAESSFRSISVAKRIHALTPKYREVIILFYYNEFTLKEISQIIHVPVSTVGTRFERAKQKLRILLKEEFEV